MLQLSGILHYRQATTDKYKPFTIVNKELQINYPEDMGVIVDGHYTLIINHHLVETTLHKMFYEVKMEIDLRTIYYHELEKDVLFRVDVHLLNEKDVNRFLRKNKIQNLLQSNG